MLAITLLALATTAQVHAASNIASWFGHRGTILQNTVVLEGGLLRNGTFANGKWSNTNSGTYPYGLYMHLDLCTKFETTQWSDSILIVINESLSNDKPKYVGGGIFANTHQFYTYGGLPWPAPKSTDSSMVQFDVFPPDSYAVTASTAVNFIDPPAGLPSEMVTNGAYASAQAQSRGYWIGGMQSATGGEIVFNSLDDDADHVAYSSSLFFMVDMKDELPTVNILAWPSWLAPRSEGSLVWLPVGQEGVLLAIGGVKFAGDLFITLPDNATTDDNVYGDFMTNIAVYDIASSQWSLQQTLGSQPAPQQLASFCTVVTQTQDGSSHMIYVYGGYDGTYLSPEPNASDEVWVLAVPSFQWTKVSDGNTAHRRKGHVCVSPNPTTMISIGGAIEYDAPLGVDTIVDVFDLSSTSWTGNYDPQSNTSYSVPQSIIDNIGGTSTGLGQNFVPNNLNGSLNSLFSTPFTGLTLPSFNCSGSNHDGNNGPTHKPGVAVIAGASVGGVVALLIAVALFFCCRKRRRDSRKGAERTEMRQNKVFSWMRRSSVAHDPEPEQSHTSAVSGGTDNTMLGSGQGDYFATKEIDTRVYEVPGSNVTSPGWNNTGQGSPYVTSPALSGSHEVDASSRHELQSQQRSSMSIRDFPGYPRSIQGEFIRSVASDNQSISHPSESIRPHRHYGHISPYELPEDKSRDDLAEPQPMSLHDNSQYITHGPTGKAFGIDNGDQYQPYAPSTPTGMARKPLPVNSPTSPTRPGHGRNASSLSTLPALPSPDAEEAKRQSTVIESLPDTGASNTYPQRTHHNRPAGPFMSAYQENFEGRPY